jgi:hypothetical protein
MPVHTPEVVSRLVDGEAVVVHPRQGMIRVLNPVGARLWELADGRRKVAELVETIVREYAVDQERARNEVLAFLADLAQRGILVVSAQPDEEDSCG